MTKLIDVTIQFGEAHVTLADANSQATLPNGVSLWLKAETEGRYTAYATVPGELVETYQALGYIPEIITWQWA